MKRWRHLQHATRTLSISDRWKIPPLISQPIILPLLISHCIQAEWRITTSSQLFQRDWESRVQPKRTSEEERNAVGRSRGGGARDSSVCYHSAGHLSAVRAITAPPSVKCLKCALACSTVASCPCDPARLALGDKPLCRHKSLQTARC